MKITNLLTVFEVIQQSYIQETEGKTVDSSDRFYRLFNFELADLIRNILPTSSLLKVKGCIGQPTHRYPKVPLIAIFDRRVTNSAQTGYYVAVLFSENMKKVVISLNQGFDSPLRKKGSASEKKTLLLERAEHAKGVVEQLGLYRPEYLRHLSLGATINRGKGYEIGHILGTEFPLSKTEPLDNFQNKLKEIVALYQELANIYGRNLFETGFIPDISEEQFQKLSSIRRDVRLPEGPISKSNKTCNRTKYSARSTAISSLGLEAANYSCAVDKNHRTFVNRTNGHNYVEAHHLVPLKHEDKFPFSLDVPENIVALCPNCHMKIHHADKDVVEKLLLNLLTAERKKKLKGRGLSVNNGKLLSLYF